MFFTENKQSNEILTQLAHALDITERQYEIAEKRYTRLFKRQS